MFKVATERLGEPFEVFTAFQLPDAIGGPNLVVHEHRFDSLRRQRSRRLRFEEGEAWFFGSPLSEVGYLPLVEELRVIGRLQHYFAQRDIKLTYVRHRSDSSEKCTALEGEGLRVATLSTPAEVHFAVSSTLPRHVASSFSAALHNVSRMVPEVQAYVVDFPYAAQDPRRENIASIVAHYRDAGMKLISSQQLNPKSG